MNTQSSLRKLSQDLSSSKISQALRFKIKSSSSHPIPAKQSAKNHLTISNSLRSSSQRSTSRSQTREAIIRSHSRCSHRVRRSSRCSNKISLVPSSHALSLLPSSHVLSHLYSSLLLSRHLYSHVNSSHMLSLLPSSHVLSHLYSLLPSSHVLNRLRLSRPSITSNTSHLNIKLKRCPSSRLKVSQCVNHHLMTTLLKKKLNGLSTYMTRTTRQTMDSRTTTRKITATRTMTPKTTILMEILRSTLLQLRQEAKVRSMDRKRTGIETGAKAGEMVKVITIFESELLKK